MAVVTRVGEDGRVALRAGTDMQATLPVGHLVTEWECVAVDEAVAPDNLDATVAAAARAAGLGAAAPFVFVVERMVTGVRLHVIKGACPVNARMRSKSGEMTARANATGFRACRGLGRVPLAVAMALDIDFHHA